VPAQPFKFLSFTVHAMKISRRSMKVIGLLIATTHRDQNFRKGLEIHGNVNVTHLCKQ